MHRFALIVAVLLAAHADAHATEIPMIPLEISGHTMSVEVAHTQLSRSQGLMYRESLEENSGMLFVFPSSGYYSMWMKNTYIPLSVAFIDVRGVILNIADMQPETLTSHDAAGVAKYALEMNKGWFAARKITAGAQVTGLERAPAAD
ncbi:MAG: DUF192 domain-containing protein [Gammaproteobacteria bacterium]|nr:MAG: DUF192 domain-containing protein [Gammaproteobacteria bacterium]